jgi:hypothetical protein
MAHDKNFQKQRAQSLSRVHCGAGAATSHFATPSGHERDREPRARERTSREGVPPADWIPCFFGRTTRRGFGRTTNN